MSTKPKPKSPETLVPVIAKLKKIELLSTVSQSKTLAEVEKSIAEHIHQVFVDKGVAPNVVNRLAQDGYMGRLFTNLVLRSLTEIQARNINNALINNQMPTKPPKLSGDKLASVYIGSETENEIIDRAIAEGVNISMDERRFDSGYAATKTFLMRGENISRRIAIIIIGAGPAGIMLARALVMIGFDASRITLLDKTGTYGGLWQQKNVKEGTLNSPFQINFEGNRLPSAPETALKALQLLERIYQSNSVNITKGTVIGILPGDLNHIVKYLPESGEEIIINAPIVVNAIGVGTPLNPDHKEHMWTPTPQEAGMRWQQQITAPEIASRYKGKMVILIGLGNSTAEMLMQITHLNSQGFNIDYRVVTHYPGEALLNPTLTYAIKKPAFRNDVGKKYTLFRDLNDPNLTKYEGDLELAKTAYWNAFKGNKILSDIIYWRVRKSDDSFKQNQIIVKSRYGDVSTFKYDYLYTLIGYGHDPAEMEAMGMKVTDRYRGSVATDYDGEVQRPIPTTFWNTGRDRVYPGYFALGAVAATDRNRNAETIPGIMHRMYDMMFTIYCRTQEFQMNVSK